MRAQKQAQNRKDMRIRRQVVSDLPAYQIEAIYQAALRWQRWRRNAA